MEKHKVRGVVVIEKKLKQPLASPCCHILGRMALHTYTQETRGSLSALADREGRKQKKKLQSYRHTCGMPQNTCLRFQFPGSQGLLAYSFLASTFCSSRRHFCTLFPGCSFRGTKTALLQRGGKRCRVQDSGFLGLREQNLPSTAGMLLVRANSAVIVPNR